MAEGPLVRIRAAPPHTERHFTIVVPKAQAPRAVARNRIRRRIRAALPRTDRIPYAPITIIASSRVLTVPFKELVEQLASAVKERAK